MSTYKISLYASYCALVYFLVPVLTYAYVPPLLVTQESLDSVTQVFDPITKQLYYGELPGFPHTYEINVPNPLTFTVTIGTPYMGSEENISAILVRVLERGGVSEVARLSARDAAWRAVSDPVLTGTYLKGPTFSSNLTPGTYLLQVHTSDNREKYILLLGNAEPMGDVTYFETLRSVYAYNTFHGGSFLRLFLVPVVYIPLVGVGFILTFSAYVIYRRRRGRSYGTIESP